MSVASSPVVLGIDFGGTKIAAAACDLSGVRLASAVVDSLPESGADAAMARGLAAAQGVLDSLGPDVTLSVVSAVTFGIPLEDRVELAPSISGWETLPFGRRLRDAFPGVPVRMTTDVKAAAVAELRWGALAGRDPALYLNLGTGLAIAIVAGGAVLAGAHQAAGEIGYMIRTIQNGGGAPAGRVLLEDAISGKALAERSSRSFGRSVTAAELFELAPDDEQAATFVDEFVRELAVHLANLAVVLDPACIVVGGGIVRSWDRLFPDLRQVLEEVVPFPPDLVIAEFPYDAPLIGALALGVDASNGAEGRNATRRERMLPLPERSPTHLSHKPESRRSEEAR